jgi:hypothetical protein
MKVRLCQRCGKQPTTYRDDRGGRIRFGRRANHDLSRRCWRAALAAARALSVSPVFLVLLLALAASPARAQTCARLSDTTRDCVTIGSLLIHAEPEGGDNYGYCYGVPIITTLDYYNYNLAGVNTCSNADWAPPIVQEGAVEHVAEMSTPTPGSQDPNFPMTEVPQKEGPGLSADEQATFNTAVQLTQQDEFQDEIEAKLKLLGLTPIYFGAVWDKNEKRVLIRVAVDNKVTPELASKFARYTNGIGEGIPVELVQGHPIKMGKDFMSSSIKPAKP